LSQSNLHHAFFQKGFEGNIIIRNKQMVDDFLDRTIGTPKRRRAAGR